jgi:serine/threonine protein kinase
MELPSTLGGRYEIVRPLGQGGMGRVLLARDIVLGRQVAVKVLRDDLGVPPEVLEPLVERMRQEARAAAALGHPHMVTLHDMGEAPEVGLYLVFEYVEGPTLRERLGDGPLPPAQIARMALELGEALTHAHEAGVVHRDVKPENVLLAKTGAKVTDFGIARIPDSTLTRAGAVLGTPAYSAPEALASAEFSPLSDQFSLAATLYEALSGVRAFPGEEMIGVATRVATEAPAPLGTTAAARSLAARPLARVEAVLQRGLAKDPAKRFPSAIALGEAFAAALDPEITTPSFLPTPLPARTSLIPRATRRWQNMIAAVALLVIIGLLLGGRRHDSGLSLRAVASAFAEAIAAPSHGGGHLALRPHATGGTPTASASASAGASEAAAAAPASSTAGTSEGDEGGDSE